MASRKWSPPSENCEYPSPLPTLHFLNRQVSHLAQPPPASSLREYKKGLSTAWPRRAILFPAGQPGMYSLDIRQLWPSTTLQRGTKINAVGDCDQASTAALLTPVLGCSRRRAVFCAHRHRVPCEDGVGVNAPPQIAALCANDRFCQLFPLPSSQTNQHCLS